MTAKTMMMMTMIAGRDVFLVRSEAKNGRRFSSRAGSISTVPRAPLPPPPVSRFAIGGRRRTHNAIIVLRRAAATLAVSVR